MAQRVANQKISATAIGVMSGTSLDGLDLCLANFNLKEGKWSYSLKKAQTISYHDGLRDALRASMNMSGRELMTLDANYGVWIGKQVAEFTQGETDSIDLIGSHGHTVFHEPANGFSTQIGSGAHIAANAGIACVCNFRMGDVARRGQGAPLVPIGDELLFSDFDFCLNIGGIANISYREEGIRAAYDVCPVNMAANHFANILGYEYDNGGRLGEKGRISEPLLNELNSLDYYKLKGAKSLGREWFDKTFLTKTQGFDLCPEDVLRTIYEHAATKISDILVQKPHGKVLVTGGGAKNTFLINLLKGKCQAEIYLPCEQTIDFKEALIFAFLAVLYNHKINSSLGSATGAKCSSIAGSLYY